MELVGPSAAPTLFLVSFPTYCDVGARHSRVEALAAAVSKARVGWLVPPSIRRTEETRGISIVHSDNAVAPIPGFVALPESFIEVLGPEGRTRVFLADRHP